MTHLRGWMYVRHAKVRVRRLSPLSRLRTVLLSGREVIYMSLLEKFVVTTFSLSNL